MTAIKNWHKAFSIYAQPCVMRMTFLGFSAGLPYLLVFSTLSAWLRDDGITNTTIGFFSWVGVTYSFKVFLAPAVDRLPLPWLTRTLGKRRSWMLLAQLGIAAGLFAMSRIDIHQHLELCALLAVWVALCSASQDIAIDAYRIESAVTDYQGAMAATYVLGYRIALLLAGAGAFYLADFFSWSVAYAVMACTMLVGFVTTLAISEPEHPPVTPIFKQPTLGQNLWQRGLSTVSEAVFSPFIEFFQRNGKTGLLILLLIALYKMSDITMGVMANPFYLDLGFKKTEIADVSKIFGFFMTIAGAALGGLLTANYGIMRPLLLGSVMIASTNILFAVLAVNQPDLMLLAAVISADNLSGGLAGSVFIAYLSSMTSTAYTATQYALFTSLMILPAQLLAGFSGVIVDHYGYPPFFIYTALLGLPAIGLVSLLLFRQRGGH
ncbi:MAG: AmpG family muropeptide MFS transporter [Methylobacter sp.]|nr:MAG: AmpG family muropeptide MFS transporter [Methylobacter sp.]